MWVMVPGTSCPSVLASEGSTSASSWPIPQLERSLTLRGRPTPARSWLREWRKGHWLRLLCGRTPEPSMAERGVAWWIASLGDTRASGSQRWGSSSVTRIPETSGRTSEGSSRSASPAASSSRTSPTICDWGSDGSPRSYGSWASGSRADYSRRLKSASPIGGSGYSPWPTSQASDWKGVDLTRVENRSGRRHAGFDLPTKARLWSLRRGTTMSDGTPSSEAGRGYRLRLNPEFVEWLMGLPPSMTACLPQETLSSLWWQRMRSYLWRMTLACTPERGG